MAGSKGLTESTGVKDFFTFVGHRTKTQITFGIDTLCQFHDLFNLLLDGVNFDLHLIENSAEFLMKLTMKNNPEMFKGKAFFDRPFTNPNPHDISLTNVHDSLDIVHQVMKLTLKDGFKVRLHFTSGNLNQDTDREILAFFNVADIRTFHDNKAIFNFIHFLGNQNLDPCGSATTAFHVKVIFTDTLTLESGTKRHGNVNLGHVDLQTTNLNGLLNNFIMSNI